MANRRASAAVPPRLVAALAALACAGSAAAADASPASEVGPGPALRAVRPSTRLGPAPSPNLRLRSAPLPKTRGDVRGLYRAVAPATVIVRTAHGYGSGVVVSPRGLVLTNHHVAVDGEADGLRVRATIEYGKLDADGVMTRVERPLAAHVLKWDRNLDLAVLALDDPPPDLPAIAVSEETPTPGQPVAALGHGAIGLLWSIRDCQIAGMGRLQDALAMNVVAPTSGAARDDAPAKAPERGPRPARVIQTTCPISPGDSGGPLVDSTGRLVGLNDFYITRAAPITTNFHVDVRELRAFLAEVPAAAPPMVPDPWDGAESAELADHDDDRVADTLVLSDGEGERAAILVDPAQTSFADGGVPDAEEVLAARSFRARAAFLERGGVGIALYDLAGSGAFDLALVGDAEHGLVEAGYRLARGGAEPLERGALPARLADPALFRDPALAKRFDAIARGVVESWTPAPPAPAVPEPTPAAADAAPALVDLNGDRAPDAVAWRGDDVVGVVFDTAGALRPKMAAADALAKLQATSRFALVIRPDRTWAFYGRARAGAFDLALSTGAEDDGAIREAMQLGAGEPRAAPDQAGRLAIRPELVALSPAGGRRLAAALGKLGLAAVAARDAGLGSLPAVQGAGWTATRAELEGLEGAVAALQRDGAMAVVADLSGRMPRLRGPALAKATARGALPVSFAWLRIADREWAFYDRDGNGAIDLALFSADPSTGRSTQAYVVGARGALVPDAALADGPLFRTTVFAAGAARERVGRLYEALGVREEARER